jgi:DNA-binding PadR family transcriptional regulator
MFRFLILGLLRHGLPLHGFALLKEYRDRSGLKTNTGNFYREMPKLLAEGLVRYAPNPAEADERRIPYEITDAGRAVFDAWLSDPGDSGSGGSEDEMSTRALFLGDAAPEVVCSILDHWKDELLYQAKGIERERRAALVQKEQGVTERFVALPVLLSRRLKRIAADLEFVEDFRSAHEEWLANKERPKDPPPRRRSPNPRR